MSRTRQAFIATCVVLAGFVAYGLIWSPRPSQSEKDTAAVASAAGRFTHEEIAEAWAQSKLGNPRPLERIQNAFPLPSLGVHEEGTRIVLIFASRKGTCIHHRTGPDGFNTFAQPC